MRTPISSNLRFEILKRDGFTCQYCGANPSNASLEVGYIVPLAKGGEDSPRNLITSCLDCYQGKGDNDIGSRKMVVIGNCEPELIIKTLLKQLALSQIDHKMIEDVFTDIYCWGEAATIGGIVNCVLCNPTKQDAFIKLCILMHKEILHLREREKERITSILSSQNKTL